MRRVLIFRILGLIGLAIATSAMTASIASQMKRSPKVEPQPSATTKTMHSFKKIGPPGTRPILIAGDPAEVEPAVGGVVVPSESGGLQHVEVNADGDRLMVSAEATFRDSRGYYEYCWAIRVFDPEDRAKPVFWWFYTENRWKIDPSGAMTVNFREGFPLPLPKKRYLVEVSVRFIPPGADLTRLKDPTKNGAWMGVDITRPVVVGR